GAVAIPRAADRPTGSGPGQSAPSAPGRRPAAGGGAGSGSGFSDPDHCRSRCHRWTFPSDKQLSSWVGACPGDDESAGVNYNHRSPKGNRHMRRVLNQAANAAVKVKGSIFEIAYRRSVPRLGHNQTIGAIAHRQCRLIWLILHQGVRYKERGPGVTKKSKQLRTWKMIRQLRNLGYRIEPPNTQPSQAHAQ